LKSKAEIEVVLNKANDLDMNQALSLLKNIMNCSDSLCFNCIDEILVEYKINRDNVDVQSFNSKFIVCRCLLEHQNEEFI
tara:strand:- start:15080 stop:15319 length:240 start_codon:yes stop_codon:yes gene_type:complete